MIDKKPLIATVLYRPSNSTYQRICLAISEGFKIYIFDNYPNSKTKIFIGENKEDIKYFTFGKNVGIGPALKLMCATAYYEDNQNLLYLDQDTIYNKETLKYILNYIAESSDTKNIPKKENILSVTFRDAAITRKEKRYKKLSIGKYELTIVDFTISSGTLFSLEKLKIIGWHDEEYYMDGVDYRLCLSAEKAGYKVAEIFNTPGLDHETEQENRKYKILFKTYRGQKYPINRIIDYVRSSLKLIAMAALMGSKKTKILIRLLIIYLLSQFILYLSKGKQLYLEQ